MGIYSSIDDLAKWDAALYDDRLLNNKIRELAFTPVTATDDPTVLYGMGWRITEEKTGGTTQWHSGETMGFRNVIIRYPQRHFTVILLTNRNDPEPYQTARAIAQVFLQSVENPERNLIVRRSSTTRTVRPMPYFDRPALRARCFTGISITRAPRSAAMAGMKRCSSP
jgi:CubicO group peptidase (beta-lactamase class C family)